MRGKRALDAVDDDIRDYIERETQDNIDRGLSPDEARRQAMIKFGNVARVTEDTRAVWAWMWLEQLLQDVRHALRSLRRNPGVAAVVILTLAVAIGMNTAVLSVFNAVARRPLPYPNAERLVWVSTVGPDEERGIVVAHDFADWRQQATSFDRMVAYGNNDSTLVSAQGATRVRAVAVTEDFWDLSGATPARGRLPRSDEREVVLSHRFAQRWFGDDADVIGRMVSLDGHEVAVVGILPENFRFYLPDSPWVAGRPADVDVYRLITVSSARVEQQQLFNVVARLRPGTTLDQGRAEIAAIRARIAETHPNPLSDLARLRVVPLKEQLLGRSGPALLVLLAASVFVLLIACANAANLLLARASVRYKEIAVRMSVGAGRLRVIRQLLVESLVLVTLATAAGLPLALLAVAGILGINPHAVPRLAETTLDTEVLVVVLGVAALSACLFGLAPAAILWKVDLHDALKNGVRTASPSVRTARTRRLIVAGEVALALVLLIGAGLMLKSAWRMYAYPDGFDPGRILTAKIELFASPYTRPQKMAFVDTLLRGLQTAPGVEAFSISTHGYSLSHALVIEGERLVTPEEFAVTSPILVNSTTAALKRVMGFRMVRGRWFSDDESAAVLNETLARRAFPGRDAIGHRIQVSDEGPWLTVVGIVADLKYSKLDESAEPEIYVPYARAGDSVWGFDVLILSAGDDPLVLAPVVRQLVSAIDSTQIVDRVMTLEQALADSIAPRRLNLLLLGTFAGAAMLLAAIGIYGVMAYSVTQRVHEIGVRMALGARRSDVVGMVVRQGLHITLAGIVVGLLAALALARVLENLLYDVQPTDPMTFAVVTAVLTLTAVVACCVPALKAAFVDPVITLRNE